MFPERRFASRAASTVPVAALAWAALVAVGGDVRAEESAGASGAAVVASAPVAAAPTPEEDRQRCVDSFKRAQRLRRKGELLSARAELLACGQPSCPDMIEVKCIGWADEVRAAIPSLVVHVRDHLGRDVVDATILVDGEPVSTTAEGLPIEVDPGVHALGVRVRDRSTTVRFVATQGTKDRPIRVMLPEPAPAASQASAFSMPVLGWVGFGVGAAGLAVGTATGVAALVARDALDCPGGTCFLYQESALSSGRALAHASTASFGLAAAGVLTGTLALTWLRPAKGTPPAQTALVVAPNGILVEGTLW